MIAWFEQHEELLSWLFLGSLITFVGTLIIIPLLVLAIPADYFRSEKRVRLNTRTRHPLLHMVLLIVKNSIGSIFIVTGIAMLVLPGQGLITLLIGVMLCDFPGKYRLERKLIRYNRVQRALNWVRRKGKRPELQL